MLNDFLGEHYYLEGVGKIYPITIKEYDKFRKLAEKYIIFDKRLIDKNIQESTLEIIINQIKAFEIVENDDFIELLDENTKKIYEQIGRLEENKKLSMVEFKQLLKIILHNEVEFDEENNKFIITDTLEEKEIRFNNFDKFREIVMRQNLLFAPLYYDDPILQNILESLRSKKQKNNVEHMDLEAIVQLVCIDMNLNPEKIRDFTYYQLIALYQRLQLKESYDWTKRIQTSGYGSKDIEVPRLDKTINLNRHPEEIDFNTPAVSSVDTAIQ